MANKRKEKEQNITLQTLSDRIDKIQKTLDSDVFKELGQSTVMNAVSKMIKDIEEVDDNVNCALNIVRDFCSERIREQKAISELTDSVEAITDCMASMEGEIMGIMSSDMNGNANMEIDENSAIDSCSDLHFTPSKSLESRTDNYKKSLENRKERLNVVTPSVQKPLVDVKEPYWKNKNAEIKNKYEKDHDKYEYSPYLSEGFEWDYDLRCHKREKKNKEPEKPDMLMIVRFRKKSKAKKGKIIAFASEYKIYEIDVDKGDEEDKKNEKNEKDNKKAEEKNV